MLHFLFGLALCIWIAERVAHWMHERRYRKLVAEMLNTTPRFTAAPQPRAPDPEGRALGVAMWSVGCAAVILGVLLVAH
jgi:hypothetical protein